MKITTFSLTFGLCLLTVGASFFQLNASPNASNNDKDQNRNFRQWAETPPMGWNSWDCFGPTVEESEVKANADYMAEHLKEFGWKYVVVDIRWFVENDKAGGYNQTDPRYVMDAYGRYLPAVNRFPSAANGRGFKELADYIHAKGLKFGIHIMRGIPKEAVAKKLPIMGTEGITADQIYSTELQCPWLRDNYTIDANKAGAQEYYQSIMDLYASWGVDFIKIDDLSKPYHQAEIEMIRKAIDRTGRAIVLSTSPGKTPIEKAKHVSNHANMWRMVDDVWDTWGDLKHLMQVAQDWYPYIQPGTWPDCDMIPLGRISIRGERGQERSTRLTQNEQYSLMTFFSIFRSPLMFGGNLPDNDDFTLSLLTNEEVMRMHQQSSRVRQLYQKENQLAVTSLNESTGEIYLALFNTDDFNPQTLQVDFKDLGLGDVDYCGALDLWQNKTLHFKQVVSCRLDPHSCILLKLKKDVIYKTSTSHNPVLKGLYADPDILYSEKDGKFYIYPTSDGFDGWSGKYFKVFSSSDLVEWKDEGVILDLPKDVSWADRNAWAPCILEKKINGEYKYFFYFTAAQKIGVAVSDQPTGPFVDSGRPLVNFKPEGARGGQEIDPDVFTDPVSGKTYLYWGNGYMAVAELNDDMISLKPGSVKRMKPDGTFREGTHVLYRNGLYYFLWSQGDTRSENYRVRYGYSDQPTGDKEGRFIIPENNLIIAKDPEVGIYGTGHNSTIKIPGKDEWYIVYHRFNYPNGIHQGDAAGYNREVCIDSLIFDKDGMILRTAPTHQGIAAIDVKGYHQPDSFTLLAYPAYSNGLYLAWTANDPKSADSESWSEIGPKHRYLSCDYGAWGSEKKMYDPFLMQGPDGLWHCVWGLNAYDGRFAHAASSDLIHWKRQSYPFVMKNLKGENCLQPECFYDAEKQEYVISWLSNRNIDQTLIYYTTTKDFKEYAPAQLTSDDIRQNKAVSVENIGKGTLHRISAETLRELIYVRDKAAYWNSLHAERCENDAQRFSSLKPLQAQVNIQAAQSKEISDMLIGIFFEDINYSADGGLYAELIQNGSFEYHIEEARGRNNDWDADYAWSLQSPQHGSFQIENTDPLHANNPHYVVLNVKEKGKGIQLINDGFDNIALKAGDKYLFSVFGKMLEGKKARLKIALIGKNGESYGSTSLSVGSNEWKKYQAVIMAEQDVNDARLEIAYSDAGSLGLDMISLFPQKTFKNRPNGMRTDLAQTLADLHPRFVRFPGGCVAHGDGLDNIYRWKNTIGPIETRHSQPNIWGYHQSYGLGYYEYFQFCEDIGAEPLPVLAAGVPCQNSKHGGQQDGIPMDEMDDYVQDILDLIEWANGDANSFWGKKRAEAGHPEPFQLKYIGIGNEDLITDVFEERFRMIFKAIREKYPEIQVIGTVGPFYEGSDYEEGWDLAEKLDIPLVDEHYYNSPGWYIYHQDFYDRYDRNRTTKVYLGEYASHLPGRPNNLETALSEALYLTAVERNADVVSMTSYAPLLAKNGHTQWNPDLIYFNNTEVRPTVGYYVQQLYGQNSGNSYLENRLKLNHSDMKVACRVSSSVVRDEATGDVIIKLVNMLPVGVSTKIHLDGIDNIMPTAQKTILTGQPTDRNLQPQRSEITIGKDFQEEMPAYSFTVIRIKTNIIE